MRAVAWPDLEGAVDSLEAAVERYDLIGAFERSPEDVPEDEDGALENEAADCQQNLRDLQRRSRTARPLS